MSDDTITEISENTVVPWKVVTHHYPDTDAYVCLWAALRFVVKDDPRSIIFVRAGESLPEEECEGYRVLTMDTGKGELDQHEKSLGRTSSFEMFTKAYGLDKDPALADIIELTRATDSVEQISRTNIHYVFKGLSYQYRDPETKEVDWLSAVNFAIIALDILYSQAQQRVRSAWQFKRHCKIKRFENGLWFCDLGFRPWLANEAFNNGVDVVLWTQKWQDREDKFYPAVQTNVRSNIVLDKVMLSLRIAEAKARGIDTKGMDLWAVGDSDPQLGKWFFHDSHKLILCGSRGHELLEEDEFTKLTRERIAELVSNNVESLPKQG